MSRVRLPYYQVDAFTSQTFRGNPAGVCILTDWLPDPVLQRIAAENNLSETAFFIRQDGFFHLRWFTPAMEVDLCGHATLAPAFVLFAELGHEEATIKRSDLGWLLAVIATGGIRGRRGSRRASSTELPSVQWLYEQL